MSKRRKNGEGTIYQDKTGLWKADITLGYDETGKRIRKVFSSMDITVLKQKLTDAQYLNQRRLLSEPSSCTVEEWVLFWLNTYKKDKVKPSTFETYYYIYLSHIQNSKLGTTKLQKINHAHIQIFINQIAKKNYSTAVIKKVLIVLNGSFKVAIKNDLIYKNPCDNLEIPKSDKKSVSAMTEDEQLRFENTCQSSYYGNVFIFALNTGMRIGEILALTWNDIDFEKNMIYVRKNISSVMNFDTGKTEIMINTPKTSAGERNIPLNTKSRDILIDQQKLETVFCFGTKNNTPFGYRNVRSSMSKILEKSNIENHYTIHSLRHTFATRLLERGANIKAISKILGHTSIKITLDIYSHICPEFEQDTVNLLDD